ncbi:hypothetical protein GPECTOR_14g31 [Gonium pectorale]|uniref:N-acetyltransferase domain-containing protein n=1 Tax=Gonium pectorale TaxID=33097 RepID=A0A150GML9_GONPE|nr:hypothetical protein GPECTOR_14g31 [Gonium pectorale]|eukprot:KXZ51044.1 hypothetical protein GPECTOR_14g31 [Gonium pectorale]
MASCGSAAPWWSLPETCTHCAKGDVEAEGRRVLVLCSACFSAGTHAGCHEDVAGEPLSKEITHGDGLYFCGHECQRSYETLEAATSKRVHIRDEPEQYTFELVQYKQHDRTVRSAVETAMRMFRSSFAPLIMENGRDLLEMVCTSYETPDEEVDAEGGGHNFSAFRLAILRSGGTIITAATLRVFGNKFAEMPFVSTREGFRRAGNCKRLMKAVDDLLLSAGVRVLVIPSINELLPMWTRKFGFDKLGDQEVEGIEDWIVDTDRETCTLVKKNLLPPGQQQQQQPAAQPAQQTRHKAPPAPFRPPQRGTAAATAVASGLPPPAARGAVSAAVAGKAPRRRGRAPKLSLRGSAGSSGSDDDRSTDGDGGGSSDDDGSRERDRGGSAPKRRRRWDSRQRSRGRARSDSESDFEPGAEERRAGGASDEEDDELVSEGEDGAGTKRRRKPAASAGAGPVSSTGGASGSAKGQHATAASAGISAGAAADGPPAKPKRVRRPAAPRQRRAPAGPPPLRSPPAPRPVHPIYGHDCSTVRLPDQVKPAPPPMEPNADAARGAPSQQFELTSHIVACIHRKANRAAVVAAAAGLPPPPKPPLVPLGYAGFAVLAQQAPAQPATAAVTAPAAGVAAAAAAPPQARAQATQPPQRPRYKRQRVEGQAHGQGQGAPRRRQGPPPARTPQQDEARMRRLRIRLAVRQRRMEYRELMMGFVVAEAVRQVLEAEQDEQRRHEGPGLLGARETDMALARDSEVARLRAENAELLRRQENLQRQLAAAEAALATAAAHSQRQPPLLAAAGDAPASPHGLQRARPTSSQLHSVCEPVPEAVVSPAGAGLLPPPSPPWLPSAAPHVATPSCDGGRSPAPRYYSPSPQHSVPAAAAAPAASSVTTAPLDGMPPFSGPSALSPCGVAPQEAPATGFQDGDHGGESGDDGGAGAGAIDIPDTCVGGGSGDGGHYDDSETRHQQLDTVISFGSPLEVRTVQSGLLLPLSLDATPPSPQPLPSHPVQQQQQQQQREQVAAQPEMAAVAPHAADDSAELPRQGSPPAATLPHSAPRVTSAQGAGELPLGVTAEINASDVETVEAAGGGALITGACKTSGPVVPAAAKSRPDGHRGLVDSAVDAASLSSGPAAVEGPSGVSSTAVPEVVQAAMEAEGPAADAAHPAVEAEVVLRAPEAYYNTGSSPRTGPCSVEAALNAAAGGIGAAAMGASVASETVVRSAHSHSDLEDGATGLDPGAVSTSGAAAAAAEEPSVTPPSPTAAEQHGAVVGGLTGCSSASSDEFGPRTGPAAEPSPAGDAAAPDAVDSAGEIDIAVQAAEAESAGTGAVAAAMAGGDVSAAVEMMEADQAREPIPVQTVPDASGESSVLPAAESGTAADDSGSTACAGNAMGLGVSSAAAPPLQAAPVAPPTATLPSLGAAQEPGPELRGGSPLAQPRSAETPRTPPPATAISASSGDGADGSPPGGSTPPAAVLSEVAASAQRALASLLNGMSPSSPKHLGATSLAAAVSGDGGANAGFRAAAEAVPGTVGGQSLSPLPLGTAGTAGCGGGTSTPALRLTADTPFPRRVPHASAASGGGGGDGSLFGAAAWSDAAGSRLIITASPAASTPTNAAPPPGRRSPATGRTASGTRRLAKRRIIMLNSDARTPGASGARVLAAPEGPVAVARPLATPGVNGGCATAAAAAAGSASGSEEAAQIILLAAAAAAEAGAGSEGALPPRPPSQCASLTASDALAPPAQPDPNRLDGGGSDAESGAIASPASLRRFELSCLQPLLPSVVSVLLEDTPPSQPRPAPSWRLASELAQEGDHEAVAGPARQDDSPDATQGTRRPVKRLRRRTKTAMDLFGEDVVLPVGVASDSSPSDSPGSDPPTPVDGAAGVVAAAGSAGAAGTKPAAASAARQDDSPDATQGTRRPVKRLRRRTKTAMDLFGEDVVLPVGVASDSSPSDSPGSDPPTPVDGAAGVVAAAGSAGAAGTKPAAASAGAVPVPAPAPAAKPGAAKSLAFSGPGVKSTERKGAPAGPASSVVGVAAPVEMAVALTLAPAGEAGCKLPRLGTLPARLSPSATSGSKLLGLGALTGLSGSLFGSRDPHKGGANKTVLPLLALPGPLDVALDLGLTAVESERELRTFAWPPGLQGDGAGSGRPAGRRAGRNSESSSSECRRSRGDAQGDKGGGSDCAGGAGGGGSPVSSVSYLDDLGSPLRSLFETITADMAADRHDKYGMLDSGSRSTLGLFEGAAAGGDFEGSQGVTPGSVAPQQQHPVPSPRRPLLAAAPLRVGALAAGCDGRECARGSPALGLSAGVVDAEELSALGSEGNAAHQHGAGTDVSSALRGVSALVDMLTVD